MKKVFKRLCLLSATALTINAFAQSPQLLRWVVPPYQINFVPTASSLAPLLPSPSTLSTGDYNNTISNPNKISQASNSMHDASGNLLFFVTQDGYDADNTNPNNYGNLKVFDKTGKLISALTYDYTWTDPSTGFPVTALGYHFPNWAREISIIPAPGNCSRYYIVLGFQDEHSASPIFRNYKPVYALLDLSLGTNGQIITPGTTSSHANLADLPGTPVGTYSSSGSPGLTGFGLATTPYRPESGNKNYYLYVYGHNYALNKYSVDATGINFINSEVPTLSMNGNYHCSEMEVVKTGTRYRVALVNSDYKIYFCQLDYTTGSIVSGTEKNISLGSLSESCEGLEFSPDGNSLYYSYHTYDISGTIIANKYGYITGLTSASPVLTNYSPDKNIGFIEYGNDGKMYFNPYETATTHSLISLTVPNAPGTGIFNNTAVSIGPDGFGTTGADQFSTFLPDQIDGQVYYRTSPVILGNNKACSTAAEVYTLGTGYDPSTYYTWTIVGGTPSTYYGTASTLAITWPSTGGTITVQAGCSPPTKLIVKSCCRYGQSNRVANPDFSLGFSGFTSGLTAMTGCTPPGTYTVSTNFSLKCSAWAPSLDHTGVGIRNFLIVDGGTSAANKTVWQETVTVCQGKNYKFSFWALASSSSPPVMLSMKIGSGAAVSIGGINVGTWTYYEYPGTWPGITGPVVISIIQAFQAPGTHYGIDDVSFGYCCNPITVVGNTVVCASSSSTTLTANGAGTYTWTSSAGTTTGATIATHPTVTTVYTVTGSDGCGCIVPATVTVTVLTGCKSTGINNAALSEGDAVLAFPNPNNGIFTIELGSEKGNNIFVYDAWGRLVVSSLNYNDKQLKVDISDLPNGLYTIKVIGIGSVFSQKIIKE